jgi:hypothetical protein
VRSGAQRSARFAGWVVSALAAQAQIGRTASAAQPVALRRYYQVLTIFELKPDAAIPTACGGSGGTSALALVCGADACTLWVLTRDGQRLISAGVSSDAQGSRVLQLSEGLAGACASSDATVVVDGASADPRWDAEKEEQSSVRTESALCVPVRAKGGAGAVVGVAQILKGVSPAATSAVHFSTEEQALVNMIVHAAGAVIAVSAMWAASCASSAAACAPHRTAGSPSSFISFPFVSFPSTELPLSLSLSPQGSPLRSR